VSLTACADLDGLAGGGRGSFQEEDELPAAALEILSARHAAQRAVVVDAVRKDAREREEELLRDEIEVRDGDVHHWAGL
jgi:hypothetical protein